jgi:hypothetical protein
MNTFSTGLLWLMLGAEVAAAAAPQVVELDPGNAWAVKTVEKLTPEVQVRCGLL